MRDLLERLEVLYEAAGVTLKKVERLVGSRYLDQVEIDQQGAGTFLIAGSREALQAVHRKLLGKIKGSRVSPVDVVGGEARMMIEPE